MTESDAFAPLTTPMPSLDLDRVGALLEDAYGIDGSLSHLGGERDQNVRVEADEGTFVLKISNPADDAGDVDLQNEAMAHVRSTAPDIPVMALQPTADGEPWTTVDVDGDACIVRLFTFMPGRIASGDELDYNALFDYGADVARVGRALRGFFHPEADYDILWDVEHALELREILDAVKNDGRRALAARVLDRFEARVAPAFDGLRAQVVHNDLSFDNVLFGDDDRISGVVDFGDLTHTALVCDLAIALARVMRDREDPLEAAEAMTRGYASVTPLEDDEARLLGDLVAARLTALATIAAWRVDLEPDNAEYIAGGLDTTWRQLEALDDVGFDVVGRRLRVAAKLGDVPYDPEDQSDLLARREAVMGPSPLSYRNAIHVVAGDGVWLQAPDGERYLDAYNNVQVVGHANPRVADAIGRQAGALATNTRYLHEAVVELAERLVATLPDGLDRVLFVNSGSEANEVAWRLAKAATGNGGALVTDDAYHGVTDATTAFSPKYHPVEHRPDWLETVPPPAPAGLPTRDDPVGGTAEAVSTLEDRGHGVAAFVFDTLFTSDGIFRPTDALGGMVDRVHEAGGLVVADEVQAGFARAGPDMWGFDAAGVTPDIVTFGKPMGNGHPVAAVATSAEVAAPLMERNSVFSTFGGNPVSAVAALAVLDEIEDRDLTAHAADVGAYLREGIAGLRVDHPAVDDVRGVGLMTGVDLVDDAGAPAGDLATDVVNALRDRGVLVGSTGVHYSTLKIRPPLVFERAHADRLVDALDAALADCGR